MGLGVETEFQIAQHLNLLGRHYSILPECRARQPLKPPQVNTVSLQILGMPSAKKINGMTVIQSLGHIELRYFGYGQFMTDMGH